jgi:hypothetical protein
MKAAIFLLAFSAATGFALGTSFSGLVILLSNLALTTLSAIVMQSPDSTDCGELHTS